MLNRIQLAVLILIFTLINVLYALIQGKGDVLSSFDAFSIVVNGMSAVILVVEHWLWPHLPKFLVDQPDIRGTWQIKLQSSHENKELVAYLVIRQRASFLSVRMHAEKSSSESCCAQIQKSNDGLYKVGIIYLNNQDYKTGDSKSGQSHKGAYLLDVQDDCLSGEYWTNRDPQTRGLLKTTGRSSKEALSFEEARKLFK